MGAPCRLRIDAGTGGQYHARASVPPHLRPPDNWKFVLIKRVALLQLDLMRRSPSRNLLFIGWKLILVERVALLQFVLKWAAQPGHFVFD